MSRTLYLQVLDYDRFSRDDPIGEICLPLSDINLRTEQVLWRTLLPCKGHTVFVFDYYSYYSRNFFFKIPKNYFIIVVYV